MSEVATVSTPAEELKRGFARAYYLALVDIARTEREQRPPVKMEVVRD